MSSALKRAPNEEVIGFSLFDDCFELKRIS
jgi:hypothetical protein